MIKIQYVTMLDCHSCAEVEKTFNKVLPDFPKAKVEKIDIASPKGLKLVAKYSIMTSPGIIINGELFSTGGLDKKKLTEKLKSLK